MNQNIIPEKSPVYQQLLLSARMAEVLVFSGLPGVGKSLYINQFQTLAKKEGRKVTIIQWDIARKAFETPEIAAQYPMGKGEVHNGLKLIAGAWLIDTIKAWLTTKADKGLLLIEAPLVGHRFVEIAKKQADTAFEDYLSSPAFQVMIPIPSKEVRNKIEADRRAQVQEDAQQWTGAKPSVMLLLWKMLCGIAKQMGRNIPMDGQPPYDPEVYEFVFSKVLQRRHFIPLHIEEIYKINIGDEAELHHTGSLAADPATANRYAQKIWKQYPDESVINKLVDAWYLT